MPPGPDASGDGRVVDGHGRRQGRRYLYEVDGLRADDRQGRDQRRDRPVLGRPDAELDRARSRSTSTTRPAARRRGRRAVAGDRAAGRPDASTSCTSATSRSPTRRCPPPSAARTARSPTTARARAAAAAGGGRAQHGAPAADVRHRHDRGGPGRPGRRPTATSRRSRRTREQQQACIDGGADHRRLQLGLRPVPLRRPRAPTPSTGDGGARVAEFRDDGRRPARRTACRSCSTRCSTTPRRPARRRQSVLDQVVPGYYQRLNATGAVETSTCCQNVATEHAMAQKLMVDSVVTWARDYKVDGFRFDLMGHHSKANMLAVRAALDALTPGKDGVDGTAIYLYGEGWNFGEVADNALFDQATQGNLGGTGIGTFNDRLRDAVHGGSPFDDDPRIAGLRHRAGHRPERRRRSTARAEQALGSPHDTDLVRLGLAGNLRDFAFTAPRPATVAAGDEIDYNGQPAGTPTSPTRSSPTSTRTTTRRSSTCSPQAAGRHLDGRPGADEHAVAGDRRRCRRRRRSGTRARTCCAASRWTATATTRGDWFNRSTGPARTTASARACRRGRQRAEVAVPWSRCWRTRRSSRRPPTSQRRGARPQDLLRLRFSTPLFRLGSADLIEQKVTFPDSGADAHPGVIVMRIDDTVGPDVDPALDGRWSCLQRLARRGDPDGARARGPPLPLSPVQAGGRTRWSRRRRGTPRPGR